MISFFNIFALHPSLWEKTYLVTWSLKIVQAGLLSTAWLSTTKCLKELCCSQLSSSLMTCGLTYSWCSSSGLWILFAFNLVRGVFSFSFTLVFFYSVFMSNKNDDGSPKHFVIKQLDLKTICNNFFFYYFINFISAFFVQVCLGFEPKVNKFCKFLYKLIFKLRHMFKTS